MHKIINILAMETGKKQLPEAEVFFSDVEFRKAVDVAQKSLRGRQQGSELTV